MLVDGLPILGFHRLRIAHTDAAVSITSPLRLADGARHRIQFAESAARWGSRNSD
jgi:hypothetical protein